MAILMKETENLKNFMSESITSGGGMSLAAYQANTGIVMLIILLL